MRLPRKQADLLHDVIERWKQEGVLPDAQAGQLTSTIEVQPFDWRRLAKYSFWAAIFCLVTAVSSALADRILVQLIERLFATPHIIKCVGMVIVATGLYWWGVRRRGLDPAQVYRPRQEPFINWDWHWIREAGISRSYFCCRFSSTPFLVWQWHRI